MYLAPIISQLSCKWCHGIRCLCTKNYVNCTFWANFDKCHGLWPLQEPGWEGLRFIRIWKVCIEIFWFIFKSKHVFSTPLLVTHMPNNLHSIMYHDNNIQSPMTTYQVIVLHGHWAIFHLLEFYPTNQIPFCQSRLHSSLFRNHYLVSSCNTHTLSNGEYMVLCEDTKQQLQGKQQ